MREAGERKEREGRAERAGPDDAVERACWEAGEEIIVGVDEVGRGAWAGPMMVGAVALRTPSASEQAGTLSQATPKGIRDSKQLSPKRRAQAFELIADWCAAWSVGAASAAECDELGMSAALKLATRRCLDHLPLTPDKVLVDGTWNFVDWLPSQAIAKGDQRCVSIAAASIMAKVSRDALMVELAPRFAPYCFDSNKGYPAPVHKAAITSHGPCAIHRVSWSFMKRAPNASPVPQAAPLALAALGADL